MNHTFYSSGINIVLILYFLPILVGSLWIFFGKCSYRTILIVSTLGFTLYTSFLHFFIRQIAVLFSYPNGTIHFIEYATKLYFICLPLAGFSILTLKKENRQKAYFLIFFKIILFVMTTLVLEKFFYLKGVLYCWPLCEFFCFLTYFLYKFRKSISK